MVIMLSTGPDATATHSLLLKPGTLRNTSDSHGSSGELPLNLRNASDQPVIITEVTSSCGCTVIETKSLPWTLASGETGVLLARIDFRGKRGRFQKTVRLKTSAGEFAFPVVLQVPAPPMSEARLRNQLVALADRQAVFKGDCARCHVAPAAGRKGERLFQAACAICHEAEPRAENVPSLFAVGPEHPAAYWRDWVSLGKAGSLMPAFASEHGGFLTAAQVESLVAYLVARSGAANPVVP